MDEERISFLDVCFGRGARRGWVRWLIAFVLMGMILMGVSGWSYYRGMYPYGFSHKCEKAGWMFFEMYADDHGGKFPDGAGRGEALSKLVPKYTDVEYISGKTVDTGDAEDYFEEHGVLSDALCGWGYLPGLSKESHGGLALFWDPSGLGHNGDFHGKSWHFVLYVSGAQGRIAGENWDAFLEEQRLMLEKYGKGPVAR